MCLKNTGPGSEQCVLVMSLLRSQEVADSLRKNKLFMGGPRPSVTVCALAACWLCQEVNLGLQGVPISSQ